MADARPDLIIRNATLIDGTGAKPRRGDLAVSGERIQAIGDLAQIKAAREIDAGGKALAPGFIDVHTHDDRALMADPAMSPKASQGVTTVITGNCGISLAPFYVRSAKLPPPIDLIAASPEHTFKRMSEYLDRLDREPAAINSAALVGHATLRVGAMDRLDRPATESETAAMCEQLDRALDDGAIGLSTGLFYRPAIAAPTEEVIALAKRLAPKGAIHTTHMRDEGDQVTRSIEETIAIGRSAKVPVVISHHKVTGKNNHGRTAETLPMIERARQRQPLALDVYPYIASSTVLDPRRLMGAAKVLITWSLAKRDATGRYLADIAAEMGLDMEQAAEKLLPAGAIYFTMDEADVQRVLKYDHAMIGSDGLPHDFHPHPRLWGTFPRVLGHYARDIGLFPLEEAVRRMTGFPAAQFGLKDRGVLRAGAFADLVLFDPATVLDRATFEKPKTPAAGIELVFANGRAIWRDGAPTGERPGRALRLKDLGPMGRDSAPAR
ncbi:MAG TPA: D-aminoacylase [Candidatus Cybelea sp.]|nr:D-aminoacylase [Candidatus Cybelea sp.]